MSTGERGDDVEESKNGEIESGDPDEFVVPGCFMRILHGLQTSGLCEADRATFLCFFLSLFLSFFLSLFLWFFLCFFLSFFLSFFFSFACPPPSPPPVY